MNTKPTNKPYINKNINIDIFTPLVNNFNNTLKFDTVIITYIIDVATIYKSF